MKAALPRTVSFGVIIGLSLAVTAFGAPPIYNFGILSAEGHNLGGVYTDPYNGCIGCTDGQNLGTPVQAFCDDFVNEVNPPQFWTAYGTSLSDVTALPSTVYYSGGQMYTYLTNPTLSSMTFTQTQEYIAAAILAGQSLNAAGNNDLINDLSYALWAVFDPGVLGSQSPISGVDLTNAKNYLSSALQSATGYASGADYEALNNVVVTIYTPEHNGIVDTSASRPQEFIVVGMPEASAASAFTLDFLGVGIVGLAYWRRRRSQE